IPFLPALRDRLQEGDGSEGLGPGEPFESGVAVPGLAAVLVGRAGPAIDNGFPADLHAQCGSALLGIVEQLDEGILQRFKAQVEMALNLQPDTPRSEWPALFQPRRLL